MCPLRRIFPMCAEEYPPKIKLAFKCIWEGKDFMKIKVKILSFLLISIFVCYLHAISTAHLTHSGQSSRPLVTTMSGMVL